MSHAKQTRRVTRASCETRLHILETLPGAVFVIDDAATILYANTSAQALTGATPEEVVGTSLWHVAPHLVSPSLSQAVQQARQTQEPTDVAYASSVTQRWLHVHLAPTEEGLTLLFHEESVPTQRQETLLASERHAVAVLNDLQIRFALLTPEGIVLDINEAPFDHAHIRREEVLGKPLAQAPWWSSAPASQKRLRAAIEQASTGETVRFEALVRPQEGMVLHLEHVITPHVDADHHIAYLVIAGIDITARKRAEAEMHALIDAIPQLVWTGRPDGSVDYYNQRWHDYTGLSAEQAWGEGWMRCTHPDDRQRVRAVWQHAIQTGKSYETEQRLRHGTTGAYRWFLMQATPYKDAQGTILNYIGTCTDIDDQKQAEQRLKESEERFRMLAETVPQLVWTVLPDGSFAYTNQRYREYTQANFEIRGDTFWHQYVHPEDLERTLMLRRRSLATGEPFENEYRLRNRQTGEYRWFLARGLPMHDEEGQIVKWFGTSTDIEEQKRIEEALRQSQERVNALMNSSIIGININEGEQVVDANDTFLRMTGYTRKDLHTGKINWMHMTPPEYLARTLQAQQELDTQQSVTPYEKEFVCKDGSRLPVVIGRVSLQTNPSQGIGFVLDNSARQELDQRKDDFISMASHELRAPLTTLKLQAALLNKRLGRQSMQQSSADLAKIEAQVNRGVRLMETLLDVSRIQTGALTYAQESVDLDALLWEIADTMQQTDATHLLIVHGSTQTMFLGDRDRLGQVFTNLLSNAIKYSPTAQTVEIDLSTAAETVTISVRDHGLGIPREQREKIFERFYRAASARQHAIPGMGIGLYLVAEIVTHYGGTITVESQVGHGSTFTVTLPCTRES